MRARKSQSCRVDRFFGFALVLSDWLCLLQMPPRGKRRKVPLMQSSISGEASSSTRSASSSSSSSSCKSESLLFHVLHVPGVGDQILQFVPTSELVGAYLACKTLETRVLVLGAQTTLAIDIPGLVFVVKHDGGEAGFRIKGSTSSIRLTRYAPAFHGMLIRAKWKPGLVLTRQTSTTMRFNTTAKPGCTAINAEISRLANCVTRGSTEFDLIGYSKCRQYERYPGTGYSRSEYVSWSSFHCPEITAIATDYWWRGHGAPDAMNPLITVPTPKLTWLAINTTVEPRWPLGVVSELPALRTLIIRHPCDQLLPGLGDLSTRLEFLWIYITVGQFRKATKADGEKPASDAIVSSVPARYKLKLISTPETDYGHVDDILKALHGFAGQRYSERTIVVFEGNENDTAAWVPGYDLAISGAQAFGKTEYHPLPGSVYFYSIPRGDSPPTVMCRRRVNDRQCCAISSIIRTGLHIPSYMVTIRRRIYENMSTDCSHNEDIETLLCGLYPDSNSVVAAVGSSHAKFRETIYGTSCNDSTHPRMPAAREDGSWELVIGKR